MARFGVRLENDPTLTPQDYQELGAQAERNGFEAVWVPEGGGRDSLTSLATIAMKTEKVMLGTGILPIFARTATNTAMGAAGMAAVSGGRFILGLGVGHRPTVESRDGIPFKQPMTRLRETIQIVKALLSGEEVNFPGKQFKVSGASLGAAAPKTKVPIYIAALGPQMLQMAGELADGVLMNWTAVDYLVEAIGHIKRGAEKAGRDPKEIDIAGYVRVTTFRRPGTRCGGRSRGTPATPSTAISSRGPGSTRRCPRQRPHWPTATWTKPLMPSPLRCRTKWRWWGRLKQCRAALEKRRDAGLQLPVIAPFAVGDNKASHRHVIDALAPSTKSP